MYITDIIPYCNYLERSLSLMHTCRRASDTHGVGAADELITASIRPRQAPSGTDGEQGIYFFHGKQDLAPDNFVHWWFMNDSIYESDHKQLDRCPLQFKRQTQKMTLKRLQRALLLSSPLWCYSWHRNLCCGMKKMQLLLSDFLFFQMHTSPLFVLLFCWFFCFNGRIFYCSTTSDPTNSMFTCALVFQLI